MNGPVAVAKLISMLLLAIAGYTGFTVPKPHPDLVFLSSAELQHRFCGGPCPIHAFFPPGSTLYVEQGLDIFETHFLQTGRAFAARAQAEIHGADGFALRHENGALHGVI